MIIIIIILSIHKIDGNIMKTPSGLIDMLLDVASPGSIFTSERNAVS